MAFTAAIQTAASPPWTGAFARRLAAAVRRDAGVYLTITLYALFAQAASVHFERDYFERLVAHYVEVWMVLAGLGLFGYALARIVVMAVVERPISPLARLRELVIADMTPEKLSSLMLYLALGAFMGTFTSVKMLLPLAHPFQWDAALAALDRLLHLGIDPWQALQPLLGHHAITRAIEYCYSPMWMAVAFVAPLLFLMNCKDERLRKCYVTTWIACWIVNGTIVAGIFMSGGPVFYGMLTGDPTRFAGLVHYLAFDAHNPLSAVSEQRILVDAYRHQGPAIGAGISAFPSLHIAMASLFALAIWQVDRRWGALAALFAGIIVIGSIHLGWHYAVGDYYALASTWALWWAAGRLLPAHPAAAHPRSPTSLAQRTR